MRATLVCLLMLALFACGPEPVVGTCPVCDQGPVGDGGPGSDAIADVAVQVDAEPYAGPASEDVSLVMEVAPPGSEDSACPPGSTVPSDKLWPVPGELYYLQLGLGGAALGEAAVVVGPDGTVMLVDAGNDSHDDDVRDALQDVAGAMELAGFLDVDAGRVHHILVTHFHADHGDGVEDLLEHVDLDGVLVHRGRTDMTDAANDKTFAKVCNAASAVPGREAALCSGATAVSCDPGTWQDGNPATACNGLFQGDLTASGASGGAGYVPLGGGARLDVLMANATVAGDAYEELVGPLLTDDSNGENARSVVALLRHGAFRFLLTGDLTGGGSDTDDVEGFLVPRLGEVSDLPGLGVDVLHAGHHGRNTSSNAELADALLPRDGRARNVVMGVSTGHLGSPHSEVLHNLMSDERLAAGFGWTTRVAVGGSTAPGLIDADGGAIVVRTYDGGAGYFVQAIDMDGEPIRTQAVAALRAAAACD